MTDHIEVESNVAAYAAEKRKGAVRTMSFAALIILLLASSIFAVNTVQDTNNGLRDDLGDKRDRITALETTLDNQRQQFIDCINVPTDKDRYCASTVAPPAEDLPVADGEQGPAGIRGLIGPRGPQGLPGLPGGPGLNGRDGSDGRSGAAGAAGEAGSAGADGGDGADGRSGEDGTDGADGKDGRDGVDGAPGKDGPRPTSGSCSGTTGTINYDDGTSIQVPGMCPEPAASLPGPG